MQEPLNDSLGLNSTGEIQEQQVVPGVPPPGQPATAGNGEQTGIPPAFHRQQIGHFKKVVPRPS